MEIYSEKYDRVLKLIQDTINVRYVPKDSLETDTLECILETFKKNEEPS